MIYNMDKNVVSRDLITFDYHFIVILLSGNLLRRNLGVKSSVIYDLITICLYIKLYLRVPFTFHSRAILEDFEESSEKKPTKVDFKVRNLNIHKGRSCVSNVLNFKMHIA